MARKRKAMDADFAAVALASSSTPLASTMPASVADPAPASGSSSATTVSSASQPAGLRDGLLNLFLTNALSAQAVARLARLSHEAGAAGVRDIGKLHHPDVKKNTNISRNLQRRALAGSLWPKIYWARVPILNPKDGSVQELFHPFLLPHEWLAASIEAAPDLLPFLVASDAEPHILKHVTDLCQQFRVDAATCVPLGLHSDGVPCGSRTFTDDSLELVSLNLPCLAGSRMRIPFTSLQRRFLVKGRSFDRVMEVLKWSLQQCVAKRWPSLRHDGSPFMLLDRRRQARAGKPLPCRALLVEIRFDWAAFKQVLHLPQWNTSSGICWRCKATPHNFKQRGQDAEWRTQRLTTQEFFERARLNGMMISPLFSSPGVTPAVCLPDWLHACDLGLTSDFAGNAILDLLACYPGNNAAARLQSLWPDIQIQYREHNVRDRLLELRMELVVRSGKSPKLRAKGAIIRSLIPVLDVLVQRHFANGNVHQQTVFHAMKQLKACYGCLERFDAAVLEASGRRFALLLVSLETSTLAADGTSKRWAVKPKLHMFMELITFVIQERGNPRFFGPTMTKAMELF